MLKLLLDEHISPAVAEGLRRRNRRLAVFCMAEWEDGEFLGQHDLVCLQQAATQRLTLVTYDRRTIPPVLKIWGEEGRNHGGVIFVDEKSISPSDTGGLIRGLSNLWGKTSKWDWTNRVCFLRS
jgi:hypothetical protein